MAEGSALKAMVSFFTVWQQEITQEDMDAMERKFHLAPVVGALLGLAVLIVSAVLVWVDSESIFGSSMFTAIAVLATVFVGSRFLHFDGLADFGDGSVVAGTQEDHVRALKDTLIGAGALGVALTVTLFNFAEYTMAGYLLVIAAPCTEVLVKNAQVAAAAFGIPGHGMAGRQVSETGIRSAEVSSVISLILVLVFAVVGTVVLDDLIFGFDIVFLEDAIFAVVFALIASVVAGYLMARRSNRVFGMVNGDILGATNEISRAVIMAVFVLFYAMVV
ncbi:MAG: adenosylcobinamide-GDP ribazoletransferase [Thermoplasmata archaeon]|nr:adenosylcobinamide-GDP ribazoletransferase [Thermoplasmata archaeon]